jgi:hypothetical protein
MNNYTSNYFGDTVYDIRNMASKSTSKNISEKDVKVSFSDIGAIWYPIKKSLLSDIFLPVFLYVAMSMTMSMSSLHEHRNRKNLDADTDMDTDTNTDTDKDIRM